ncbi:MAG: class I SAM-dependent methyltransferase [Ignavibacteria bacterium]|nr:class I SAM-dependent methyltransferase [Ignavibacteria bacterium]
MNTSNEFFDTASSFYNSMVGFNGTVDRRVELLKSWLPDLPARVADIGAGSGIDTFSAIKLGHKVVSFEPSAGMLSSLNHFAREINVDVETCNAGIESIPEMYDSNFDVAFSLGNTLALVEPSKLAEGFHRLYAILKPGGKFVMQILNYRKILQDRQRIIGITSDNEYTYIRFYDFIQDILQFNILRFTTMHPGERELITTKIYPYTHETITSMADNAGFQTLRIRGGLDGRVFDELNASDLVLEFLK